MIFLAVKIHSFDDGKLSTIPHEKTDHFQVTKDFLESYKSFYKHLGSTD